MRSGPLCGTVRYAGGFGGAEGNGAPCGAVPVPFAGKGKGVRRGGKVVVKGEEVKEVVVRAAGEAVDLVALGIEAHGGVPVKVGRVQTAEPFAGINAPVIEVVDDPGTERSRRCWAWKVSFLGLVRSIVAHRPGDRRSGPGQ